MQQLSLVNKGRLADSDTILADLQRSTVVRTRHRRSIWTVEVGRRLVWQLLLKVDPLTRHTQRNTFSIERPGCRYLSSMLYETSPLTPCSLGAEVKHLDKHIPHRRTGSRQRRNRSH